MIAELLLTTKLSIHRLENIVILWFKNKNISTTMQKLLKIPFYFASKIKIQIY